MVEQWVKEIVEQSWGPSKMAAGRILSHPTHGLVKITGGSFWGEHGVSNFWTWRKVDNLGRVHGRTFSGYGWC